jgi:CHAT domain-containing protein
MKKQTALLLAFLAIFPLLAQDPGSAEYLEAYYLVKDEFRKDTRWGHPYYWAAFTMYE